MTKLNTGLDDKELHGSLRSLGWTEVHPYDMGRSYGSPRG